MKVSGSAVRVLYLIFDEECGLMVMDQCRNQPVASLRKARPIDASGVNVTRLLLMFVLFAMFAEFE